MGASELGRLMMAYAGRAKVRKAAGGEYPLRYVSQDTLVMRHESSAGAATLTALSPSNLAFTEAIAPFALASPIPGTCLNKSPSLRPNRVAIVLHCDFDERAELLGSDLEHESSPYLGWRAAIANPHRPQRKCAFHKVAHHGSANGDCAEIWSELLLPAPVATLTPFRLGKHNLPNDADKARICFKAPEALSTSTKSATRKLSRHVEKIAPRHSIYLAPSEGEFGAIRLRAARGSNIWTTELFGAAGRIGP